ncbi:MAG: ATP synthase F1 subunit gamma [bacterium]
MFLKEIKQKINSTKRISQVTKALELVSAVKMKKAQKAALLSRPFARKVIEILKRLYEHQEKYLAQRSFYFQEREVKKVLVAVITSDKGFCSSFNQNILKFADKEIKKIETEAEVEIMPIGKKAISFFKKKNRTIKIEFTGIGDYGKLEEIKPIARLFLRYFEEDKYQKVYIFYTEFISTFIQETRRIQLLPAQRQVFEEMLVDKAGENGSQPENNDYIFEPNAAKIFNNLIPQLIEFEVHQAVLEANASEHSARMMAMKNASQNAKEIIEKLTLNYNKVRQNQITSEISEISSAKEVMTNLN